jgi:hypothetical protein
LSYYDPVVIIKKEKGVVIKKEKGVVIIIVGCCTKNALNLGTANNYDEFVGFVRIYRVPFSIRNNYVT